MLILLGLGPAKRRRARVLLLMAVTCALCLERLAALHGGPDPRTAAHRADLPAASAPQGGALAVALADSGRFAPPEGLDDVSAWGIPTHGYSALAGMHAGAVAAR